MTWTHTYQKESSGEQTRGFVERLLSLASPRFSRFSDDDRCMSVLPVLVTRQGRVHGARSSDQPGSAVVRTILSLPRHCKHKHNHKHPPTTPHKTHDSRFRITIALVLEDVSNPLSGSARYSIRASGSSPYSPHSNQSSCKKSGRHVFSRVVAWRCVEVRIRRGIIRDERNNVGFAVAPPKSQHTEHSPHRKKFAYFG
jgi:hypothetical protein